MTKKLILLILICFLLTSVSYAQSNPDKAAIEAAIKSYKNGNYLGSIQALEQIIKNNPGNALAYYYTAISYVKLGESTKANESYDKVIMLSPDSQLSRYAEIGKKLLVPPSPMEKSINEQANNKDQKAQSGKNPHEVNNESIEKDIEERNLKLFIEKVNRNKQIDPSEYQQYEDFSPDKSKSGIDKPTGDEIVHALQTLMKAGINPLTANNPAQTVNPQMMEMNMMTTAMGGMNPMDSMGSQTGGNSMNNMLPLLMMMQAQNSKSGTGGYDPQYMQAMLSNIAMPNMMDLYESKNDRY